MAKGKCLYVTVVFSLWLLGTQALAQQTTTTHCNINGNSADCTSNTTDYGEQQRRAYEAGQQVGNALGTGIARAMQQHAFSKGLKKYCAAHPGQQWNYYSRADGHVISSGYCPSEQDNAVAAANEFMAHHKEYVPCPENSQAITNYVQQNRLDPRERKTYERAFNDLKKAGQLQLYKR